MGGEEMGGGFDQNTLHKGVELLNHFKLFNDIKATWFQGYQIT